MTDKSFEFGTFRLEQNALYHGANQPLALPAQAVEVLRVFLEQTLKQGKTVLDSPTLRRLATGNRDELRVQLRVQLVEAATANVIWLGKFAVNAADSATTEQLIAQQVAQALGFDGSERASTRNCAPPHPEAVPHCRKGRYLYSTQYNRLDERWMNTLTRSRSIPLTLNPG